MLKLIALNSNIPTTYVKFKTMNYEKVLFDQRSINYYGYGS